jgi:membrane protein DedA with SNARE-associated domain
LPHVSPAARAIFDLIRQNDVLALGVLIFLEEMGIPLPLPGNFLLMYLGMQVTHGRVNPLQTVATMTIASILGSITLYCIAERVGRPAMLRWGRYFGLEQKRVARIETWLDRYGSVTIALGRLMPGLRTPTSAVGGIFDIPLRVFIPFTSLAGFIWTVFWLVLGAMLGRSLHLSQYMSGSHLFGTLLLAGAFLLVLPTIGFISARRERHREAALRAMVDGPASSQPLEEGDNARAGHTEHTDHTDHAVPVEAGRASSPRRTGR